MTSIDYLEFLTIAQVDEIQQNLKKSKMNFLAISLSADDVLVARKSLSGLAGGLKDSISCHQRSLLMSFLFGVVLTYT